MGHHCCHDSVFVFYVLHASSDAVESDHKRLCPPKSEEGAEESEVEDQITDVREVFLLVVFLKRLSQYCVTFCRKSLQYNSYVSGFMKESTMLIQKC